jgi:putative membrane protein
MQTRRTAIAALTALGVCLSLGPTSAFQATPTPPNQKSQATLSTADRNFIIGAARGGMAEVKLGQLAADRAASDAVKQFGQRMVQDHGKANDELTQLAQQKGVTLPQDMGTKNQQVMDRLSKLSGAAFDRAYMADMVKDHQKDIAAFQREATRGQDPDVRAWAAKTLPTLQEHYRMAREIHPAASPARQGTAKPSQVR